MTRQQELSQVFDILNLENEGYYTMEEEGENVYLNCWFDTATPAMLGSLCTYLCHDDVRVTAEKADGSPSLRLRWRSVSNTTTLRQYYSEPHLTACQCHGGVTRCICF